MKDIKDVPGETTFNVVHYILSLLALVGGFIYLVLDYKKTAAVYYKLYMVLYCLLQFSLVSNMLALPFSLPRVIAIFATLSLVSSIALAFGKDLGKKFSTLISLILVVSNIVIFIAYISDSAVAFSATSVLLAGTAALMVNGKYIDKASRGTN